MTKRRLVCLPVLPLTVLRWARSTLPAPAGAALAGVRLEGAGYDGAEETALADMLAAFAIESHVENADAPDSLRCIRAFMPDSNTLAAFIPAPHNPPRTGQPSRRAWNRTCPRAVSRPAPLCIS